MSDRGPSRRVYVGRLSTRTRDTDLEAAFDKYGRCRVDLKSGFAFVEYDDERDAEDAIRALDNTDLDGSRIVVEQSHGRRGGGPGGPGGPSGGDSCFACGGRGHWARDCPSSRYNPACFLPYYYYCFFIYAHHHIIIYGTSSFPHIFIYF
eukprot:TRINITY_DN1646_c0_g1_i1.p1 TRINITY_DN1646_c0_g1~~TRINITY_DN1646_c0_g1_i1.p1  ORF type:complete len:166 (-),score=23.18 TRINITY_DN1646_c0_g1_i1:729-1178(-)